MKVQSLLVSFMICVIFIFSKASCQDSIPELQIAKMKLISDPLLQHASLGICVIDLKTKEKVLSHNEKISLTPASTVKLFATASAYEMLGPNYKPRTKIYYDKKLDKTGILNGNLWIRGSGDVSLGSRYYTEEGLEDEFLRKWADTLYSLGLRKIEGNIIGDASEFSYQGIPDGWSWSNMGNYYGAGPSGLPIYDNMLRFYFKLGGKVGSKATLMRIFPEINELTFRNEIYAKKSRGDNSNIYGAPFSYSRFGTGYLPRNSSSYLVKGTLPDPEMQFVTEFKRILIEKGIQVPNEVRGCRLMELGPANLRYKNFNLIYTHEGRTVNSIAWWTNKKSVNLFAEQLVCWIAKERGTEGSTDVGLNQIERYWNPRINTSGLNIKDGSGLSRSNSVSAENFCSLLVYMHKSEHANLFKETLAITGESGTLSTVCYKQIAHGRIKGKSGTMNKVKAFSGYVTTISGKELAFSLIANNYSCTNDGMVQRFENLMNAMAKY